MTSRRIEQIVRPHCEQWQLVSYLIRSNPNEAIDLHKHNEHLERIIRELETHCLSGEFEYDKTGFIISHFGNRGIHIAVWHWGRWGTTREVFSHSWYSFGRDYDSLSLLDIKEPIFSEFEIPLIVTEFLGQCRAIDPESIVSLADNAAQSVAQP